MAEENKEKKQFTLEEAAAEKQKLSEDIKKFLKEIQPIAEKHDISFSPIFEMGKKSEVPVFIDTVFWPSIGFGRRPKKK